MSFKQKHPETCLAKCLMILLEKVKNKKISDNYELELLIFSLKYERENIARGHLEKVVKDFKVNIDWYVDSKIFFYFVKKMKLPKKVSLINRKIDLKLIDQILEKPIILYLDRFHLWNKEFGLYYKYHYPHFIIVNKRIGDFYEIIDPDNGKISKVESNKLSKAIISLKNHLWISPQIIQFSK
ncbi:MAG: hypothetical protein Q7R56_01705 [Nanoarchaeota archaeon]|nr:hypothetical protein [Nanoarchaeota archaeon]